MKTSAYEITTESGFFHGIYEGSSPAEALAAHHVDAGYPGVRAEGDTIVWPDSETERLCGGLDRWTIEEVAVGIYRVEDGEAEDVSDDPTTKPVDGQDSVLVVAWSARDALEVAALFDQGEISIDNVTWRGETFAAARRPDSEGMTA